MADEVPTIQDIVIIDTSELALLISIRKDTGDLTVRYSGSRPDLIRLVASVLVRIATEQSITDPEGG